MIFSHTSVLLPESIEHLLKEKGKIYVDCTLGGGGHAEAILANTSPETVLLGIDRDIDALEATKQRLGRYKNRLIIAQGNFRDVAAILSQHEINKADGFLFDLGVSSYQLDNHERGFSYQKDAELDMRMSVDNEKTASYLLNNSTQEELKKIIRDYGEERWAGRIAFKIVKYREEKSEIKTTGQLVEIIKSAIPAATRRTGGHPAKRTFQALRIAVNDEIKSLKEGVSTAVKLLAAGGRICVISFHSLEDREVKRIFKDNAKECECPPGLPQCACDVKPVLKIITRKGIKPSAEELARNPRAKSAILRVAEKL